MFGNCGLCVFFARTDDKRALQGAGICRWRPPIPIPIQVQGVGGAQIGVQSLRPPVMEGDGCGQWEGKPAAN